MSPLVTAWAVEDDVQAESQTRAVLESARRALNRAIDMTDQPLPCCAPGPNLWLSELRTERAQAAGRCGSCPVLAECAAVGAAAPLDTWGVFGGHDYATDLDDLVELRALGPAMFRASGGAVHRARRDELIVRLGSDPRWSTAALAEAVGASCDTVRRVLHRHGLGRRQGRGTAEGRRIRRTAARQTATAEVAGLDGPMLRQLRALGRLRRGPAGDWEREVRNRLLRELRESDRTLWTWARLGAVAGISASYARAIVRGYRGDHARPSVAVAERVHDARRGRAA